MPDRGFLPSRSTRQRALIGSLKAKLLSERAGGPPPCWIGDPAPDIPDIMDDTPFHTGKPLEDGFFIPLENREHLGHPREFRESASMKSTRSEILSGN